MEKRDGTHKYLRITPWVLFRCSRFLTSKSTSNFGIHIRNTKEESYYELDGRAACLWLAIDGTRSRDEVIGYCMRKMRNKDSKFPASAQKLFDGLINGGLITENAGPKKKDARANDMNEFLEYILDDHPGKSSRKSSAGKTVVKNEAGDKAKLRVVREAFSKLLKANIRFSVRRLSPSTFKGRFHIFSSNIFLSKNDEKISGLGAALTVESAAMAAVGEAIERRFSLKTKPDLCAKSFQELAKAKHKVLDPESFRFFDPHQEAIKNEEIFNISRKQKIDWTWFEDSLNSKIKTLIPAEANAALFKGPRSLIGRTSTSGCAAGVDPESAKFKATLELIERDNLLFYWRTQNTPALIDLSAPNERIGFLLDMLGPLKKKIKLFHLKSELSSVTVQAIFLGNPSLNEPRFASTSATRLNATDAIEKSLLELLFVVNGFKEIGVNPDTFYGENFDNSIWEFSDRSKLYGWFPSHHGYKFLLKTPSFKISFSDIQNFDTRDTKKNLLNLALDFRRHDLRLYFRNNTPQNLREAGFWIYRAFSPDLILIDGSHRYRYLGFPRYFKLSKDLALKIKPKSFEQLNRWPHPLP